MDMKISKKKTEFLRFSTSKWKTQRKDLPRAAFVERKIPDVLREGLS